MVQIFSINDNKQDRLTVLNSGKDKPGICNFKKVPTLYMYMWLTKKKPQKKKFRFLLQLPDHAGTKPKSFTSKSVPQSETIYPLQKRFSV
jgi:hypothetical protein